MNTKRIKDLISLLKNLYGEYSLYIALLLALGFLNGALSGIGIAALAPLFSFVIGVNEAEQDAVSKFIFQAFNFLHINPQLKTLLIFISILFILKMIVLWVLGYIQVWIINSYVFNMRSYLYRKALKSKWSFLLNQKIGHLENILIQDVDMLRKLLKSFLNILNQSTSLIVYLFIAFSVSPFITLITLTIGIILFLLSKPFILKTRLYAKEEEGLRKEITHQVNENIIGLKTIKSTYIENFVINSGATIFKKLKEVAIKLFFTSSITGSLFEPLAVIFVSIVFAISYKLQPDFSLASFLVVMYLIDKIFNFIKKIQNSSHAFLGTIPNAQRIISFKKDLSDNEEIDSGNKSFKFDNSMEFKNVSFSYNDKKMVLKDFNLEIKRGDMIGIIGSTGSGKTTIVDLILRLFSPQKGDILMDKENINDIKLSEWRKNIGYVSQDMFLKNDTIANNIKFYDESITDQEMVEGAKKANIYEFIDSLPEKFNTMCGERGVKFSGGQRQRIVLARALARKPKLLLLDEATSALDTKSEDLIKQTIEKMKKNITIIIISHRLSFIRNVDKLIVLDEGRVVEKNSPDNMLNNPNSYFYKLYNHKI